VKLLAGSPSRFHLADVVANLKRALNHRLKAIEALYHFRNFNLPENPAGYLEILECLGLVRPAIKRCAELVDMTWYSFDRRMRLFGMQPRYRLHLLHARGGGNSTRIYARLTILPQPSI